MMHIYVTFTFEGFHSYPEAPLSVSYLRSHHRHLYHAKVLIPVDDLSSRQLEFHMVKTLLEAKVGIFVNLNDTGSCEDICRSISHMCNILLGIPNCSVDISEDGENGAIYVPEP